MTFEPWQWALAAVGAALIGVSKTGLGGLGMLFVAIFANLLPTRQATGFVLPMLIFADVIAVLFYRRHAEWAHLWRLFPWTVAGVVLGYFALDWMNDAQARLLVGMIVLAMVALHLARQWRLGNGGGEAQHGLSFVATVGILAGFTTQVANAAGPLMAVYLLAMRLPKMAFVGTAAVYFLLLNLFKVPFMLDLGLITAESFRVNVLLLPAVGAGAWLGRLIIGRIDQQLFERLALGLAALAGLRLLF